MKIKVIYHRADFDGIFCYQIAKRFFEEHYPGQTEYIGWDYNDPLLDVAADDKLYMLDISVDGLMDHPNLNWVDHHKSAIDKFGKKPGYQIDGVAACRLAWQYFGGVNGWAGEGHPIKEDFIERRVTEPLAVRLAGEYDIWDKRDPRVDIFQSGLYSRELTDEDWKWLLTVADPLKLSEYDLGMANMVVMKLLEDGGTIRRYQNKTDASIVEHRSFLIDWEGLKFLVLNTARCNSLTFAVRDLPETGHDALMGFYFTGSAWRFSLYHANHRKDIDLSLIAVKHGGGGHRGACGFQLDKFPF